MSADGKRVAYTVPAYDQDGSLYNDVFVRAADGASAKTLGRAGGRRDQVCWIGDDRIAVSEFGLPESFLVFDVTGKRLPEIVLPAGCKALYPAISPDAQRVAFTGSRESDGRKQYGLFVCDVQGGAARLLVEKALKTLAAWSPDSRKIAIGAGAGYRKDHPLQLVDVSTGKVDDTGALGVGASWSPDGKLIACTTAVQVGGSFLAGVPTGGKLGIYNVGQRQMRVVEGTEGAVQPAWSRSGRWVAYVAKGKIGIASPDGGSKAAAQPPDGAPIQPPVQMGWAGDEALYLRAGNYLARWEISQAKFETLAKWDEPKAPALKPEDFKVVELPRVTVRYARFDEK